MLILLDQKICQQGETTHTKKINQFQPLRNVKEILQRKTALFATLTQRFSNNNCGSSNICARAAKFRKFNPVSGKRPKLLYFFMTVTAVLTLCKLCIFFSLAFQVNFHFLENSYKMVRNVVQPQPLSQIQ